MKTPQNDQVAPGQLAYDPASGQLGVLQSVHPRRELLFDPKVAGTRIAFLRPEGGGPEWTANADDLLSA